MKNKWLIGCWTIELRFHPFIWGLRGRGPAKAGRVWCSRNDKPYWWVRIGPFTIAESYMS